MRIWLSLLLLQMGACLGGCSMKIESPADAFNVGSQKDRTAKLKKGIFGASAEIPLTDLKGEGWLVTYDQTTNSFTMKLDKLEQSWSSTMSVENERIKDNQNLYLAMTAAQQEVYLAQIAAIKESVKGAFDAVASVVSVISKLPAGGGEMSAGLINSVLGSIGPDLLPMFLDSLKGAGVPIGPVTP